jgi:hypothetical protein
MILPLSVLLSAALALTWFTNPFETALDSPRNGLFLTTLTYAPDALAPEGP